MSLEIGYNVFNEGLFPVKTDEDEITFICGRCDVTYAWYDKIFDGNYKDNLDNTCEVIVFNPKFDGHYMRDPNAPSYYLHMVYRPFKDFKKKVKRAIDDTVINHNETMIYLQHRIAEIRQEISDYRDLQIKSATSAAFDGYQKLIEDRASDLVEEQDTLKGFDEDDYDFIHAKGVQQMLDNIEKHLAKGEVVTAYYSDQLK